MTFHPTVRRQLLQCVQLLDLERTARNPDSRRRSDALLRLSPSFGCSSGARGLAAQPSRHQFRDPEAGKVHNLLTNHRRWAAQRVADTHKPRWELELFYHLARSRLT